MRKNFKRYFSVFVVSVVSVSSFAADTSSQSNALRLSLGGKIYDNWPTALHKSKPVNTSGLSCNW